MVRKRKGVSIAVIFALILAAAVSLGLNLTNSPSNPTDAWASWSPYDGWWYTPGEAGTGVSIEVQGNRIFLTLYVYDDTGRPIWLTAGGAMTSATEFSGDLIQWTGWPLGTTYVAPTTTTVGTVGLSITSDTQATLSWTYNGADGTKDLVKFLNEIAGGRQDLRDINGWWYDADFNGMGWFMEVRGDTLFIVWYNYREDGTPRWISLGGPFTNETDEFSGVFQLWQNGPTLDGEYVAPTSSDFTSNVATLTLESFAAATLNWAGVTYNLERFWYGAGSDDDPIDYTGITEQAVIDSENVIPLTATVFRGLLSVLNFADLVKDEITESTAEISGPCGGDLSFITNANAFGDFTGAFDAADYCNSDVVVNGAGDTDGEIITSSGIARFVNISTDKLGMARGGQPTTLKGGMRYEPLAGGTRYRGTVDNQGILIRDDNVGKVMWYRNYTMQWTRSGGGGAGGSSVLLEVDADQVYNPDKGWVAVSTTRELITGPTHRWFTSGDVYLNGGLGTAGGQTRAHIAVLTGYQFRVEADTNGDGIFDWNSGVLKYDDFNF